MSNVKETLEKARSEAQDLHKKIDADAAKDNAALRANVQDAAAKAQNLAASLKTIVDGQRADAKQRIADAASQLEDVGCPAQRTQQGDARQGARRR
jgi:hypothetical protein